MIEQTLAPGSTFIVYFKNLLMAMAISWGNDEAGAKNFAEKLVRLGSSATEEEIRKVCGDFGIFY